MNQFPLLLTAMQKLASLCDGAHSLDGHGFNKTHAEFGHSLANGELLSAKQAVYAYNFANFYRRQLSEDLPGLPAMDLLEIKREFWLAMRLVLTVHIVCGKDSKFSASVVSGFAIKGLWLKSPEVSGFDSADDAKTALIEKMQSNGMTGQIKFAIV